MKIDDFYEERLKPCPACEGWGWFDWSKCCGAGVYDSPEGERCTKCHNLTEHDPCPECGGTGEIPMTVDDEDNERDDAQISEKEVQDDLNELFDN